MNEETTEHKPLTGENGQRIEERDGESKYGGAGDRLHDDSDAGATRSTSPPHQVAPPYRTPYQQEAPPPQQPPHHQATPPYQPYPPPYPPHHGYGAYPPPPYRREESSKPKIVGALLIATAILGLIFGTALVGFGGIVMGDMESTGMRFPGSVDIYGRVTSNGSALDNATIIINGTHLSTTTNEQGHYMIMGVPNGINEIVVEKEGYTTLVYRTFTVQDNNQFNFTMTSGTGYKSYGETEFSFMRSIILTLGIVAIICSIAALAGGVYALKRQNFGIVVVCTVAAIFSIGFCLGSILAIIALLILLLSSKEFQRKSTQNTQG